jgi:hypothetical protein
MMMNIELMKKLDKISKENAEVSSQACKKIERSNGQLKKAIKKEYLTNKEK